ncbi:unnamed protein product, partial [Prorocentrum cordatum]
SRPSSGLQPRRPQQRPQSRGYRSQALELQVRLQEQLLAAAALQPSAPPAAGLFPSSPGPALDERRLPPSWEAAGAHVTEAELRAYSDVFEAIIRCNQAYAPALRKVKDVYDCCAGPSVGRRAERVAAAPGSRPAAEEDGQVHPELRAALMEEASRRALAGPRDARGRLEELEAENRLLRAAAARLRGRAAEQLAQPAPCPEPVSSVLAPARSRTRSWSAMRVTSKGVRTALARVH